MTKSIFKSRVSASKLKALAPCYPVDYDREVESVVRPSTPALQQTQCDANVGRESAVLAMTYMLFTVGGSDGE